MTPTLILIVAVLPIILLIGGIRRFVLQVLYVVMQGLIWLVQRMFATVPAWMIRLAISLGNAARGTLNWITTVLRVVGWLLVAVVLINVIGIAYGNLTVLAVEAALIATCAYMLFKFSSIFGKTWGATTAVVLYGLAILGFLWPASIPVSPKALALLLLALPMTDILWHTGRGAAVPAWIKWSVRTAAVLFIVAATIVITVTQIGWLNVGWNRVKYENQLIKNQSDRQEGLQNLGLSEIDKTNASIYFWRQQETKYGGLKDADQKQLDELLALLKRQEAAVAKGEPKVPNMGWEMPDEDSLLPIAIALVVALGIGLMVTRKGGSSHA
ncbi:MAG: hypothetical protein WDN47_04060 [Candidatus Doudnabacteria bacterium]